MEHQISARLDRPLGDENLPEHYVDPSTTLGANTVEKEVSDENEKEHYVPQEPHPPNTAEPEPSVPPKASKILGLRRRVFFLIVAVIAVLVVVGAVVGGVVGSRSSNKSSSNESSSAPGLSANSTSAIVSSTVAVGSSSSVPTTSPGSVATRSSSATRTTASTTTSISSTPSVLVDKSMFKIPSIALTGAGSSRDSLLFALHSSNNSVTFHVKTTSGWQSMQGANEPILPQAPAPGSALAATSWIDGGWDEIRFYYISDNIEIMELSGSCSSATVCDWSSGRVILDSGVSTTSGLAVMHWGNSTVANKIVLLFVTSEDTLGQLTYDGLNWSYGISVSVGVAAGSGLTAVILGDDDPVLRAYWIEVSGGTNGLSAAPTGTTVPWTVSSDVPYSFSANLTPKAELASCMYPSQDLSIDYLALFQISTTGDVVEMVKQAGVGVWAPATSSFDQAEDAGGAIGCDGWSDDDDLQNLLVVYATGGLVTEYLLHDGSWSNATIFEE